MGERARIGGVRWSEGAVPIEVIAGLRAALGPDVRLLVLDRPGGVWRGAGSVVDGDLADVARGQGAFVAASVVGDRLVLRRDPIGHRSLYWAAPRPGVFVFASTLQGVLGSGLVPRALDVDVVSVYLSYAYVPGVRTLVRGVSAVPAGGVVEVGDTVTVGGEWELPRSPLAFDDEDTLRARLRATLEEVVRECLPPGRLGATLSGGIDSSLVLALARRLHEGPARAFSITFGAPHADELAWSGAVCRHLAPVNGGVEHHLVTVRPEDVRARFDEAVGALSEPNGDPLTVPNLLLFEAAAAWGDTPSSGFATLFNGEGGDPTFGGPKNGPMLLAELLDGDGDRGAAYLRAHQRCYDDLPGLLVEPRGAQERLARELDPWFGGERGLLDALMAINVTFKGAWHILPKVDALGARFGVRPRSPLFDRRLVELSFVVPGPLKRRGSVEKHLLKEAVRDLLPGAIVDRPKSGMMVPVEAWFAGPLKDWARERLLDGLAPRGLVRKEALEDLLAGRRLGLRPRRGIKIWLLLTLESWLRGAGVSC